MKFGLLVVGKKGSQVLEQLVNKNKKPVFVVTYIDKNIKDESYLDILEICNEYNIKTVLDTRKEDNFISLYDEVDKVFVIGWQFLLKQQFDKLVVIHDSYLPEHKGWSPTVNYLIKGSPYLGATAFQPTKKMDTGYIYSQKKVNIEYPLKINNAINIVSDIYIDLILDVLNGAEKKVMMGNESFCVWRDQDDYKINWNWDDYKIKRFVDAVGFPFDGAKINYDGEILRVSEVEVCLDYGIINIEDRKSHIGKIFQFKDGCPIVICGIGLIKINYAQTLNGDKFEFKKLKVRL